MVILDTGSTDLVRDPPLPLPSTTTDQNSQRQWVVSSECTEDDCQSVPTYTESSSLSKTDTPFRLNYLMGSVTGEIAFETITLGNYRISSQVFGELPHPNPNANPFRTSSSVQHWQIEPSASTSPTLATAES